MKKQLILKNNIEKYICKIIDKQSSDDIKKVLNQVKNRVYKIIDEEYKNGRVTIKCAFCGEEKTIYKSHKNNLNFCDKSCKGKYFATDWEKYYGKRGNSFLKGSNSENNL